MNTFVSSAEHLNTAVAGVLARMTTGILATMLCAAVLSGLGLVPVLFAGFFGYVLIFLPLVLSLYLAWRGDTMDIAQLRAWFFGFAAAMGVSLSLLFHTYTSASIAQALTCTTISFAAVAGWGYFTRRELQGLGPWLMAGVIGLIVAGLLNIFFASSTLQLVINVLTVVIFLALTAYDMNRIRDEFWAADHDSVERLQWFGALSLYINYINIFAALLQLTGDRE
jgi:FtsH-binding integral membrane protein